MKAFKQKKFMEDINNEDACFALKHPSVNALEQFASLTLLLHTDKERR